MKAIQSVNTELNHSKQQYKQLTEEQKQHNRIEAKSTVFQLILEKILLDGGLINASN